MITTSNGSYEAKSSPSTMRPNTWGMAGVGVNQSRDSRTLVVDELAKADVRTENIPFEGVSGVSGTFANSVTVVNGVVTAGS